MEQFAPIALFVYNRLSHTKETIEALKKNTLANQSELYIFSDGAKNNPADRENVHQVRRYIASVSGFQTIHIIKKEKNAGLSRSIISGVRSLIEKYGKVIVIEDDLVSSPVFLSYMNQCLDFYQNDPRIFSISGYCPPIKIPDSYPHDVFLFHRINSWGWATWKNRWEKVNWDMPDFKHFIKTKKERKAFNQSGEDCTVMLLKQMLGKIDSWAIRFSYTSFKNNMFTVYPVKSKIVNTGTDGSGQHVGKTGKFQVKLDDGEKNTELEKNLIINPQIAQNFRHFYRRSFVRKIINFFLVQYHKRFTFR